MPDIPQPQTPVAPSAPKSSSGAHGLIITILIILVVLSLAGTAFAYYFSNANVKAVREETAMVRQDVMTLSEQVTMTGQTLEEIQTAMEEQKAMMETPDVALTNACQALGWSMWSSQGVPVGFCYPSSWGDASWKELGMSPETHQGEEYFVSFSEKKTPLISFETMDFKLLGDRDIPPLPWNAFGPERTEAEILSSLAGPIEGATRVSRMTLAGVPAWKVWVDRTVLSGERFVGVEYYLPNVGQGVRMNVHTSGSLDQEAELDALVQSMQVL